MLITHGDIPGPLRGKNGNQRPLDLRGRWKGEHTMKKVVGVSKFSFMTLLGTFQLNNYHSHHS